MATSQWPKLLSDLLGGKAETLQSWFQQKALGYDLISKNQAGSGTALG